MIKVVDETGFEMWVPDDMANRHRVELEDWAKIEGNQIMAYTPPPAAKE
jgi:hypothetical protein